MLNILFISPYYSPKNFNTIKVIYGKHSASLIRVGQKRVARTLSRALVPHEVHAGHLPVLREDLDDITLI